MNGNFAPQVAVIWRPSPSKVQYSWLEPGWSVGDTDLASRQLDSLVGSLLASNSGGLQFSMTMEKELEDEHKAVSASFSFGFSFFFSP